MRGVAVIWLVRHGRTAANAHGLLLGRADPELDDEGRRQAEAVAAALTPRAADIAQVVSSPLRRCQATAEVVAGKLGLPVVVDDRWIEMDYGQLDQVSVADVPRETWARWRSDVRWAPPGGESLADLGTRVRAACDDLERQLSGGGGAGAGGAVVVSHVSPIKAAVAWALAVGDEVAWRMFVAPGSVTEVSLARGRSLHRFNDISHLI